MDERADELYAGDPAEFVAGRDALAKELRAAGDREAAAAVKALRRPTRAAWVLNRLAREEPEAVARIADAAEGVRAGGDLRAATGTLRDATAAALARVRELAPDEAPGTYDAVADTLRALPADPELAELVRAGRLDRERTAAGLGFALGPAATAPAPERKRARTERGPQKPARKRGEPAGKRTREQRRSAEAREREAEARRAVERKEATEALERAAQARTEAEQELQAARAAVAAAREDVAAARAALADREQEARAARSALTQAARSEHEAGKRRDELERPH